MNLDELRKQAREALELAEKAIEGPWTANFPDSSNGYWHVNTNVLGHSEAASCYDENSEMDAAFIAASRALVPDLARAVLELADEVRHLEIANRESTNMLVAQADEIALLKCETYCAFCGQRFALDGTAAQLVTEHIQTCEKHPMRAVEAELERMTGERNMLHQNLIESQAYGVDTWIKLEVVQAEEMRLRDALDQTRNYIHDDCIQTALEWIDASLGKPFEEDKRDAN